MTNLKNLENMIVAYLDTVDLNQTTMKTLYKKFNINRKDRKSVKDMTKKCLIVKETKRLKRILRLVNIFSYNRENDLHKIQVAVHDKFGTLFPTNNQIRKFQLEKELEDITGS